MTRKLLALAVAILACGSAVAADPGAKQVVDTKNIDIGDRSLFGAYGDNFVLYQRMRNNGWADNDEAALRAHYSVRYVFFGRGSYEAFLSYTGEFDFYMRTRASDPVINRISNPALHVRWAAQRYLATAADADYVEVGVEHASDGQVTEVAGPVDANAQRAYDGRDRPYFDQISRGSNFFSVGTSLSEGAAGLPVSLRARARVYLTQNNAVAWGPLAGQGVKLSDYHRLSLRVGKAIAPFGSVEAQWTVGDKGLRTDSLELAWQAPREWPFPLFVRVHRGPLNTLSNYTQRQDSLGIGLRFAAF